MRSRHTVISLEEFRLLPRDPGWNYEYLDGMAHITPRARFATVRLDVGSRPLAGPLPLRRVEASDREGLVAAYVAAFEDSVEYCDVPPERVLLSALENIGAFYGGDRGEVLSSSCVATDDTAKDPVEAVAGAALVTRADDGCPLLDILFVVPRWQRRGVGTALVRWSLGELRAQGETTLRSRYHLANEPSRAWHHRFGFTLEPGSQL
jgi:GNAT superfamily N-acetyltransferase